MFKNFEELHIASCKINKHSDIDARDHYKDLDFMIKTYPKEISMMREKGKLLKWDLHPHKDKLLHDYEIDGNKYFLSYSENIESILVQNMKNNHNSELNKWKLNHLEKLSFYGWDKYSKILFDKLIGQK